jgi:hypothetical protein
LCYKYCGALHRLELFLFSLKLVRVVKSTLDALPLRFS